MLDDLPALTEHTEVALENLMKSKSNSLDEQTVRYIINRFKRDAGRTSASLISISEKCFQNLKESNSKPVGRGLYEYLISCLLFKGDTLNARKYIDKLLPEGEAKIPITIFNKLYQVMAIREKKPSAIVAVEYFDRLLAVHNDQLPLGLYEDLLTVLRKSNEETLMRRYLTKLSAKGIYLSPGVLRLNNIAAGLHTSRRQFKKKVYEVEHSKPNPLKTRLGLWHF